MKRKKNGKKLGDKKKSKRRNRRVVSGEVGVGKLGEKREHCKNETRIIIGRYMARVSIVAAETFAHGAKVDATGRGT